MNDPGHEDGFELGRRPSNVQLTMLPLCVQLPWKFAVAAEAGVAASASTAAMARLANRRMNSPSVQRVWFRLADVDDVSPDPCLEVRFHLHVDHLLPLTLSRAPLEQRRCRAFPASAGRRGSSWSSDA